MKSLADLLPQVAAKVHHDPLEDMKRSMVHFLPSTARKAIALDMCAEWRVYELLKHYDVSGVGKFVLTDAILTTVGRAAGVSALRVKRIIRHGTQGVFWTLTITKHWRESDTLYIELRSRSKVEASLSDIAEGVGLYDPRRVSKRKALLSVEDFAHLQRLEALCFASWINDRKKGKDDPLSQTNDRGYITIPLYELERAWGRDHKVIQQWVKLSGIESTRNVGYASDNDLGKHLVMCLEHSLEQNNVYHWRNYQRTMYPRANTYLAPNGVVRGTRSIARKTAAELCNGGDVSKMRTNHEMPLKDSPRSARFYKSIDTRIKRDPNRSHYLLATVLDKRGFNLVGLYKLHYLAGSRVSA